MLILGISGGSGSGKTSFLHDIKQHFSDDELTILSQDDYYKPIEEQYIDSNGVQNFDLPTSIDLDAFVADIKTLKNGSTVQRKEYTFNNRNQVPNVLTFTPSPILVVEGLFIFHEPRIVELIDLSVLVHASDVIKVIRRIKRDRAERNYPLEDVLYRYENHVLPSFDRYIKPYLNKVDIVINNNKSYAKALQMVVCYLKEMSNTSI